MSYHNPERHVEAVRLVFEEEKLPSIRVIEDDNHMDYDVYDMEGEMIGSRHSLDDARQMLMNLGYKRWEVIS